MEQNVHLIFIMLSYRGSAVFRLESGAVYVKETPACTVMCHETQMCTHTEAQSHIHPSISWQR